MALLFLEGFEGYATVGDRILAGTGTARWGYIYHTNGSAHHSTIYRTTQVTSANSRSYEVTMRFWGMDLIEIPGASTELIFGFGWRRNNAADNTNVGICGFCDTDGSQGIVLGHNHNAGTLYAATPAAWGSPSTNLGTASVSLNLDQWYYIEVRAKLGTTTGQFEVYVDGVQVLNLTNINTAVGPITAYNRIMIGGHNLSSTYAYMYYDDLYVCDLTGANNNTFLGPVSVYSLMPVSNGSTTNLTPTGVAANWDAVNDGNSDNATTYVSTSTTGQKDYYNFETLPGALTTVAGVMMRTCSTLGTSGSRKLKINMRYAAVVISSVLKALTLGSWKQDHYVANLAPDGTAWTPAKVNSTEAGIEAG